ncbi:hypothetical protein B0T25DRAFT_131301 [Lasiosphaeria hispida]|uniref:Uncharacterized protein n=1 Tax=Lasiosphaeria hispida TaxID=260671 RepID=A0AAJ0MIZ5_9PEZI|nr:hypothetical protein B0T25DRAFT_131301 [Lasiosphaeria hispida]
MGAQYDHGVGEILTNHAAEIVLQDAAPEVVFIRCAYFMENWAAAIETIQEASFFFSTLTPLDFKLPHFPGRLPFRFPLLAFLRSPRVASTNGSTSHVYNSDKTNMTNGKTTTAVKTPYPRILAPSVTSLNISIAKDVRTKALSSKVMAANTMNTRNLPKPLYHLY